MKFSNRIEPVIGTHLPNKKTYSSPSAIRFLQLLHQPIMSRLDIQRSPNAPQEPHSSAHHTTQTISTSHQAIEDTANHHGNKPIFLLLRALCKLAVNRKRNEKL